MTYYKKWAPAVAAAIAALFVCSMATAGDTGSLANGIAKKTALSLRDRSTPVGLDPQRIPTNIKDRFHSTAAKSAESDTYEPIRINVFMEDLENSTRYCTTAGESRPDFKGGEIVCTSDDILTDEKKKILMVSLVDGAVSLHTERLNVKRVTGNLNLTEMDRSGVCGEFTVPPTHLTAGVPDTDFALYVAAGPASDSAVAWASTCMLLSTNRSAAGVLSVSPKNINKDPQKVRVVAHEILHVLGFNSESFIRSSIYTRFTSVRDKSYEVSTITSETTVAAARAHFGCSSIRFVELEDEGGSGVEKMHWERRNAKDDLMSSIVGAGYYTAMTLAVMQDLGYYTVNFNKAEIMPWGRNAGCDFLNEKCVKAGVSQFPSMFCTEHLPQHYCTSDRRAVGYCAMENFNSALPSYFQYFSTSSLGGRKDSFTDYCPVLEYYTSTRCFDGNTDEMPGSLVGQDARCFSLSNSSVRTANGSYDSTMSICANVKCGTCSYSVRVKGDSSYVTCKPGTTLSLTQLSSEFKSGTLTCPPFSEVCIDYVNPLAPEGPYSPNCEVESEVVTPSTTPPTTPPTSAPTVSPTTPINVSGSVWSTTAAILATSVTLLCLLTVH